MRFFGIALSLGVMCLPLGAQEALHAPDGAVRQRLESIVITPLAGASFSANVVTEWTHLLPDGSTGTVKNHRLVARDSSGRIFQERRYLMPHGDEQVTPVSELDYEDPTRSELTVCKPATRVCSVYRLRRGAAAMLPAAGPMLPAAGPMANGNGTISRENLGTKTVDNLELTGSREVMMLKAGVRGNEKEEPTVKEFWYSPRLQVNVITKRFDTQASAVENFEMRNVSLSEPDPKLFAVPDGYRMVRMDGQ